MKLIKTKHALKQINRTGNEALKAINQFLDMHVRCVEIVEHNYRDAKSLNHRLYVEIKHLGLKNIRNSMRNGHVYLINTLIPEEE